MKKFLLLFVIGFALKLGAQTSCGFTWSQSQPNVIDFVDISNPVFAAGTEYIWDWGDNQWPGYSWGPQNQSHTYGIPGTYVVCLQLQDSANMYFCNFCDTITVTGTLLCQLSVSTVAFSTPQCATCPNGSVNCWATNGTPPYSYQWNTGDTTYNLSGLLPGTYSCCVTDANGCVACDTVVLPVPPPPTCQMTFSAWQQSAGQVAFYGSFTSSSSHTLVTWNFGDATTGTGLFPWHQYSSNGTYTVCAVGYDSITQCADTMCYPITITITNPPCTASFYSEMDTINPNQAWIYNLSVGSSSMQYYWSWGDMTSDTGAYPTHVYQASGSYQICLVVIDPVNQCTDTLCEYLQVLRLSQQAAQTPLYVNVIPPLGSGISVPGEEITYVLFPNPAKTILTVKGNLGGDDSYTITDLAGRTVQTGVLSGSTVDVSALTSGTFIFTVVKPNGASASQRFVRE